MQKSLLVGLFLFVVSPGYAAGDITIECPLVIQLDQADERCNHDRSFELLAGANSTEEPSAFAQERDRFDTIMQAMYEDNRSHPHALSREATYQLRVHEKCLEEICRAVFNKCGSNLRTSGNYQQDTWCQARAHQLGQIARAQTDMIAHANQARKANSMFLQKSNALAVRSRWYLHSALSQIEPKLKLFTDSVPAFIAYPVTAFLQALKFL